MAERPEMTIHIGQGYATSRPTVLAAIVGSGVVVCLFDPVTRVGGMNHFVLPAADSEGTRLGVQAMDALMRALGKAGADVHRLRARLFGGSHLQRPPGEGGGLPGRNTEFIEEYVGTGHLAVVSHDLGGYLPRRVRFQTDTGKAFVKRLGPHMLRQTRAEEREHLLVLAHQRARGDAPPVAG